MLRWASLAAHLVKNVPAMHKTWVPSVGWEDPWRRQQLPTPVFWPGEFHDCIVHGVAKSQTRLSHFHFHWCWDRLRVGEEEGDRGWGGWMASSTEQTWVWAYLTPGDSEGQGSLVCCSPWGCKKLDTTEQLNNNKYYSLFLLLRLYWFPKGLCYFILCHNIWMYWFYFCEPIQSILSLFKGFYEIGILKWHLNIVSVFIE